MTDADKNLAAVSRADVVTQAPADNPMQIFIDAARDPAVDADKLERMFALAIKMQDRQAAIACNSALVGFLTACPPVPKATRAAILKRDGSFNYEYFYASLGDIQKLIANPLINHGLSYTWNQKTEGASMTVTCIVRHVGGHEIETTATGPIPSELGAMTAMQRTASTLTVLKRHSLVSALGLTQFDLPDNDGNKPKPTADFVTAEQAGKIDALLGSDGERRAKLCAFYHIVQVPDLPASKFDAAMAILMQQPKADGE